MPRGVHRGCAGATRRGPVARATGTRRLEVVRDAMIEVTMEDGPKIGRYASQYMYMLLLSRQGRSIPGHRRHGALSRVPLEHPRRALHYL